MTTPTSKATPATQTKPPMDQSELNDRLVDACKRGVVRRIEKLLAQGASLKARTKKGIPLLHWAAGAGKGDVCAALIDAGADINASSKVEGIVMTPLVRAAFMGQAQSAKVLIDKGADVNQRDGGGCTPLIWSISNKSLAVVNLLIDQGAHIDMVDKQNRTALYWAVYSSDKPICLALLSAGASCAGTCSYGLTIREVAIKSGSGIEHLIAAWELRQAARLALEEATRDTQENVHPRPKPLTCP